MNHRMRLGPIAIFLVVVAIILTTLATLTLATTNADKVMAERFAAVTSARYELEAEGQQFLRDFDEQAASGTVASEDRHTTLEKSGYTLEIQLSAPDANGNYEIEKWDLKKNWKADDPFQHIWKGAE
ncbi:MAG: hypothetical protein IJH05_04925 [Firmicutes bacterium]|nr:hypothetical protein [Bacillota bacterium]